MPDILRFLIGLTFDPRGVARDTFTRTPPPFVMSCILLFLVTFLLPTLIQVYRYDIDALAVPTALAVVVFATISVLVFVTLEGILLMLNGFIVPISTLLALALYMCCQVVIGAWIVYVYDYALNGSLLLIISVVTAGVDPTDKTAVFVSYVYAYFAFMAYFLISESLRVICDIKKISSRILGLLSLLPLGTAIICGIHIADLFRPGIIETLHTLFLR